MTELLFKKKKKIIDFYRKRERKLRQTEKEN